MTLQEASIRFQINVEKLNYYEKNGLLKSRRVINGVPDYTENELLKAGLIHSLMKAGFDIDSLKTYFSMTGSDDRNRKERIRLLRKQRCQLLEEIHDKQQSLDELDYMIETIRKE